MESSQIVYSEKNRIQDIHIPRGILVTIKSTSKWNEEMNIWNYWTKFQAFIKKWFGEAEHFNQIEIVLWS